jgi:hypothetical protein
MTFEQLWEAVYRRKAEHAAGQPITPAPWEDHAEHERIHADLAKAAAATRQREDER